MHCELIILVIITICWNKNQVFSTILEPKAVIESFLDEEVEKEVEPRKSNQFWAERILAHLNALYPWHRFLVFVNSEVAPDVMWHVDYGFYIDHIAKNLKVPSRDAFQLCHIEAEMRINAQLRHPRVVEYIGFYRDAFGDVRIVSEFMAGGDLHTFLASSKNVITVGHIFNFIAQIAEGMEYLISRQLIHRDLAARNCMLDRDYTLLKIADFGLSRQFNADATYASTSPVKLPLRWMPPECFDADGEMLRNCNFNELTDVWSFGIVMWECFARGAQPYGNQEFKEVMVHLKSGDGMQLARPELCPKMLYEQLMLRCWEQKQPRRPTFTAIRTYLGEIFDSILANCPDALGQNVIVKQ